MTNDMAKFKKIDTIGIIRGTGIVPVFYNADVELTKQVVKACYEGGYVLLSLRIGETGRIVCLRR
jgi:hypothetical protein